MASSSSDTAVTFLGAAYNGDMGLLKKMVAKLDDGSEGRFAKIRDFEGANALNLAAESGHTHICKYLINKLKFDVNDQDNAGYTALHCAITQRHLQTALYLLENGASISKTSNYFFTPLHVASWIGGKDMLQLLLSRGSDIEAKSDGGTPVTLAAVNGNREALEFLLQNKANPNPVNSFGIPILMSSRVSLSCTELLVKAGADPNINLCGNTPLHYAISKSKVEIIMYLLKMGANPDTVNHIGLTPLELAALLGDMKAMIVLFPVTTINSSIPDWSFNGIIKYVKSKESMEKINHLKKQSFHMAKSKGEEAYKREKYWDAISFYFWATMFDPTDATVWSNKSLCYARLGRGLSALTDAKECVSLKPDWAKAHYREGVAWKLLKKDNCAAKSFSIALKIDPSNLEIQKALREAIEAEVASMGI